MSCERSFQQAQKLGNHPPHPSLESMLGLGLSLGYRRSGWVVYGRGGWVVYKRCGGQFLGGVGGRFMGGMDGQYTRNLE